MVEVLPLLFNVIVDVQNKNTYSERRNKMFSLNIWKQNGTFCGLATARGMVTTPGYMEQNIHGSWGD